MEAEQKENIMAKKIKDSQLEKKLRWQDVCPTCLKYDHPDHPPECECCKGDGITEGILCELTRMDQESDPDDFKCDAYQRKLPLQ